MRCFAYRCRLILKFYLSLLLCPASGLKCILLIIKHIYIRRHAGPRTFCFKTVILPAVQQMTFFGVSGYQVLPFASLAGLLRGQSAARARRQGETCTNWNLLDFSGDSLLPVCYGNILVNDSS